VHELHRRHQGAAVSADAVATKSVFARIAAGAFMATSELKAVAPQAIRKFFELMVASCKSSPIFSSSVYGRKTFVLVRRNPRMCC
jgi:hypothetical protein